MSQLSDLKDAVSALTSETDALKAQNSTLLAKVDGLVTLTDNIKAHLVQLAEGGQLPPAELSTLIEAINASRDAIHAIGTGQAAESSKVDEAVTRDADTSDAGSDADGASTAGGEVEAGSAADTTAAAADDGSTAPAAGDNGAPIGTETA